MTKAAQKITLAPAQQIPFNKLVLSQSNVRRIKAGQSIEDLAASIARRGLIQSLHVRAVLDADGQETGMYEVPAGGRRYRALELLVAQKRLNKTAPVPCIVSDASSGIPIEEISLEENIQRAPLHPLDQFRAFKAMSEQGMSEEAIAAAFSISVQVVKQRLRLTTASSRPSSALSRPTPPRSPAPPSPPRRHSCGCVASGPARKSAPSSVPPTATSTPTS